MSCFSSSRTFTNHRNSISTPASGASQTYSYNIILFFLDFASVFSNFLNKNIHIFEKNGFRDLFCRKDSQNSSKNRFFGGYIIPSQSRRSASLPPIGRKVGFSRSLTSTTALMPPRSPFISRMVCTASSFSSISSTLPTLTRQLPFIT